VWKGDRSEHTTLRATASGVSTSSTTPGLLRAIVVSLYFKGVVSTQRERIELVKDRNDALEKEIVGLKADVERFKRQASHYPPMDRIIQVEEIRATTSSVESHIRNIEDIVRQVGTTLGKKDENGR